MYGVKEDSLAKEVKAILYAYGRTLEGIVSSKGEILRGVFGTKEGQSQAASKESLVGIFICLRLFSEGSILPSESLICLDVSETSFVTDIGGGGDVRTFSKALTGLGLIKVLARVRLRGDFIEGGI